MGFYRVFGDIGFVLGPITVTYIAGAAGGETVPALPFVVPAILALVAGIALRWAKDPAAKRQPATAEN